MAVMRIIAGCSMHTKKDVMAGEMLAAISGDKLTLRNDKHNLIITVPYAPIAGMVEEAKKSGIK